VPAEKNKEYETGIFSRNELPMGLWFILIYHINNVFGEVSSFPREITHPRKAIIYDWNNPDYFQSFEMEIIFCFLLVV
jgi:hypothetical protein